MDASASKEAWRPSEEAAASKKIKHHRFEARKRHEEDDEEEEGCMNLRQIEFLFFVCVQENNLQVGLYEIKIHSFFLKGSEAPVHVKRLISASAIIIVIIYFVPSSTVPKLVLLVNMSALRIRPTEARALTCLVPALVVAPIRRRRPVLAPSPSPSP